MEKINSVSISRRFLEFAQFEISPTRIRKVKDFSFELNLESEEKEISKSKLSQYCLNHHISHKPKFVSCIPRTLCAVRYIDLPSSDINEIKNMVKLQVGSFSVFHPNEVIIQPLKIQNYPNGLSKVMVIIVPNAIIKEHLTILNQAGFYPDIVTLSSIALFSQFQAEFLKQYYNKRCLIINIERDFADIIISENDKLIFSYGIDLYLGRNDMKEKLINNVDWAIKLYKKDSKKSIDEIVLSHSNQIKTLQEVLKQKFNLKVTLFESLDVLKAAALTYHLDNPYGINLLPEEILSKKRLKRKQRHIVLSLSLIMLIFVISLSIVFLKIKQQKNYLLYLNSQFAQIKTTYSGLSREMDVIKSSKSISQVNKNILDALAYLYQAAPSDLSIKTISLKTNDSLILNGITSNSDNVFDLVSKLENSNYFKEVNLNYAKQSKALVENKKVISFEISGYFLTQGVTKGADSEIK